MTDSFWWMYAALRVNNASYHEGLERIDSSGKVKSCFYANPHIRNLLNQINSLKYAQNTLACES